MFLNYFERREKVQRKQVSPSLRFVVNDFVKNAQRRPSFARESRDLNNTVLLTHRRTENVRKGL